MCYFNNTPIAARNQFHLRNSCSRYIRFVRMISSARVLFFLSIQWIKRIFRNAPAFLKIQKSPCCICSTAVFVDLAGIEPASESPSIKASPITAVPFTFPQPNGEQRPSGISSFIIRLQTQSFACIVSRNHNAGYRKYGYNRADEQHLGCYCNCIVVSV